MQKEGISGVLYPEANMLAMTEFRRLLRSKSLLPCFPDLLTAPHPLLISNRINLMYESKFKKAFKTV